MNVRRTYQIGAGGIRARFYCLEPVAAFAVGHQEGDTIKIGIEWCWISIARMRVPSMGIGLPNLDFGVADGLAGKVQYLPDDVEDLPIGPARSPLNPGQIGGLGQLFQRIKRPEYLGGVICNSAEAARASLLAVAAPKLAITADIFSRSRRSRSAIEYVSINPSQSRLTKRRLRQPVLHRLSGQRCQARDTCPDSPTGRNRLSC